MQTHGLPVAHAKIRTHLLFIRLAGQFLAAGQAGLGVLLRSPTQTPTCLFSTRPDQLVGLGNKFNDWICPNKSARRLIQPC
ncbi:unnamed protein product [Protopolystoma xenopodis]|uniref:Uncharacterized protein n=1 Tax=Protopolystoma xenopodis TaxID=117903 RepID=A0A3S5A7M4_9PLAT|nr:unnamed protein product [Protopolystoma xenopodis]